MNGEPQRFAFGRNWRSFLRVVDQDRVALARAGLADLLGRTDLSGASFLDVGAGSGLSSLAAREMGARVHAFDYDDDAVACVRELRQRFRPGDDGWTVQQGSVLDDAFLRSLGRYDVVHAWGVLHHTGAMWRAMENVLIPLADKGQLVVALYNHQPVLSPAWWLVKRTWATGPLGRAVVGSTLLPMLAARSAASGLLRHGNPLRGFTDYRRSRGMSVVHDWVDWLGGFPFESARPADVVRFYRARGLEAGRQVSTQSWGCNQFAFSRGGAGFPSSPGTGPSAPAA